MQHRRPVSAGWGRAAVAGLLLLGLSCGQREGAEVDVEPAEATEPRSPLEPVWGTYGEVFGEWPEPYLLGSNLLAGLPEDTRYALTLRGDEVPRARKSSIALAIAHGVPDSWTYVEYLELADLRFDVTIRVEDPPEDLRDYREDGETRFGEVDVKAYRPAYIPRRGDTGTSLAESVDQGTALSGEILVWHPFFVATPIMGDSGPLFGLDNRFRAEVRNSAQDLAHRWRSTLEAPVD